MPPVLDDDGWVYPESRVYQPYIVSMMSHYHGVEYESTQIFTKEHLLEVTPLEIKRWLCDRAFGDPDINEDSRPINCRSSTLEMCKKAVSFFMPYKNVPWCAGQGNPTRSGIVNDVIKLVKRYEVRGEGRDSEAKRPLRQIEFRKSQQLLKAEASANHKWKFPCISLMQYHLIGRVDDVCELKSSDPRGHPDHPFALKTKVRWSKNVQEERRCPDQILLAASDPEFCLHLHLAAYLELYVGRYPDMHYLFTDAPPTDKNAVKNLISQYRNRLKAVVWENQEFIALEDEDDEDGVGTHSYRKFASTYAKNCGGARDEVEIRGRWKLEGGRIVSRYIDPKQLYIDAKIEAILCVGGPIAYKLR